MFDVTAIGELLIDFTPAGNNQRGDLLFARKPGGAPANVLAANSRIGGKTAFIGKVGKDSFGAFLRDTLEDIGISTEGLVTSETVNTTLAFVQLDHKGDRSFSFYRKPGADMMLEPEDVNELIIDNSHILHFGSVSMTDEPSRSATLYAVSHAKKKGCIISYDPNYRPLLWDSAEKAKEQMLLGLTFADIIKVSEEEMILLTGEKDLVKGSMLLSKEGAALILVSLGAKGACYRKGEIFGILPAYDVKTIDTNGAGDAFLGAVHYKIRGKQLSDIRNMSKAELENILSFANAAGSLTTTKGGAITALPSLEEIKECMSKVPLLNY